MVYADPAAAAVAVAKSAVALVRPPSAWRVIRRELSIGLAWGVGLAALVMYPLRVDQAYTDAGGRVVNYPLLPRDAAGARVYPAGSSTLGWGGWLALVAEECGSVVGVAVGIGALVGAGRVVWQPRAAAEPGAGADGGA